MLTANRESQRVQDPPVPVLSKVSSLRRKLERTMTVMLLIVATTTLLVVAAMNFVAARSTLATIQSHLRGAIEAKGKNLVGSQALALRDLVADNAFGDVARLVDRTVNQDGEMVYGLFLGEDDKPWAYVPRVDDSRGALPKDWRSLGIDLRALRSPGIRASNRALGADTVFEFTTTVVNDSGEYMGALQYGLSGRALQQALNAARASSRDALLTTIWLLLALGAAAILFGVLLSRGAASRITQPLGQLTDAARALAGGGRGIRVTITSGDELQVLGAAFNHMVEEIAQAHDRLEEMNRGLEAKVEDRTKALKNRNRDMRLVMDNVDQGFLTLSLDGTLAQERSAIVDRWFGSYGAGTTLVQYFSDVDPLFAEAFALGYEALLEDVLPRELCLQQLPARLHHNDRDFRCSYFPLGPGARTEGLLVVINDITAELQAMRREAERGEVLAMFEALCRDRAGLLSFFDESSEQLASIRSGELDLQKRLIHTLKGNCGLMGMGVVAVLCHRLEEEIAEGHLPVATPGLAFLEERWRALTKILETFLGDNGRDAVQLSVADLDLVEADIASGVPLSRIQERVASWRLEPAEQSLARLGNYARALSSRLGKGDLDVVIDGGDVRLSPKAWGGVWADLVHVVRNAVDHGVESPGVRRQVGKSARPRLRLETHRRDGTLVIEIADDGGGIDWTAVRRAAVQRGLPHDTEQDLVGAIFASDVTTRAEVSTISGRGIGLAAVRERVESAGGEVSVDSQPGVGACFRFVFPFAQPDLKPGRWSSELKDLGLRSVGGS